MWKYYDKNKRIDGKVAKFTNDNGKIILDVYCNGTSHYSVPRYSFIRPFSISYSDEEKIVKSNNNVSKEDSADEILKKWLIAGCAEIEKDYEEQVKKIREIIG